MKKLLLLSTLLSVLTLQSIAEEIAPEEMYEHMIQTLSGEWTLSSEEKQLDTTGAHKNKLVFPLLGTQKTALAYKTIGFGSTFQEDLLPNTKKQMVTMYHCNDIVDCTKLVATHYCTKMNQPQFILDTKNSTKEKIIFTCDMETTLCKSSEDHVHQIIMNFSQANQHLKVSYLGWSDKKPNKKSSIYHFDKK